MIIEHVTHHVSVPMTTNVYLALNVVYVGTLEDV
jgi:hypothetical protein